MTDMNITAEQVQKKSSGSVVLEREIKMIIQTFQSEINESARNGSTKAVIPIPTNFNIVNMNNQVAQTVIYYRLIKELKNKGFSVKIFVDDSQVSFCIRWDIPDDNVDLLQMRDVIASHMNRKKTKNTKN